MTEPVKQEFKYDLKKYKSSHISVEALDEQMKFVASSGTGTIGAIIAGIKLLTFVGYIFARKILVDQEKEIALQDYELSRVNSNRTSVSSDNLD